MKHHVITYRTVPRETFSAVDELIAVHEEILRAYLDQLLWWNKRLNLVSRDVPRETIWEHIRHSLLLTQLEVYQHSKNIADAGTGGGMPGIPLACVSPDKNFVLNDIVSKKILAAKNMAKQLGLHEMSTSNGSVARLNASAPFLLVSKHAFKINELFRLTESLPWQQMVFYKGLDFEGELTDISPPLEISVHPLHEASGHSFYTDKALVVVSRK